MTKQIKVYETVYTHQDLENAAEAGSEGFIHVYDLEEGNYAFSKEPLSDEVVEELIEHVQDGWQPGETLEIGDETYEII